MTTTAEARPVAGALDVRIARSTDEVRAAQRLRHEVFHRERGGTTDGQSLDADGYDERMQHIVVVDPAHDGDTCGVVGTYRFMVHATPDSTMHGYAGTEFDLSPLRAFGAPMLELGRSCVLAPYRTRGVLNLLWREIAAVVATHRVGLMFGCASIGGTDLAAARRQLHYLHRHHLAPVALRPRAHGAGAVAVEPDADADADAGALFDLEPLIKGYIRLGASIGDGAYVDHAFNSIDVCIVMPTANLTSRSVRRKPTQPAHLVAKGPAPVASGHPLRSG
jgi:putative hemolysin